MPRVDPVAARERIGAYMRASALKLADQWEPHRLGFTVTSLSLPRVWVLNRLVVEGRNGNVTLTAGEVADEGRELMRAQNRLHARVTVLDRELGAQLEPGFRELGWDVAQNVLMIDTGAGSPPSDGPGVEGVPSAELDRLLEQAHAENFYGQDPEAVAQLRELDRRSVDRLHGRTFVAPRDAPVALAELRELDGVGEITFVQTLDRHRGGGFGRAAVDAALATSRRENELTFLEADADDWPREWYARLGFEEVGSAWEFDLTVAA
jgi:ribosomal protein S18 acetylase RimI-like enzyme